MKKRIFYLVMCSIIALNVYAASSSFTFNAQDIFNSKSKSQNLALQFDKEYSISTTVNDEDNESMKELAKKTTYYLIGPANNKFETSESYMKRKQDFLKMRYSPDIPLDIDGNKDVNSDEYAEDLFTGYIIPNMFIIINDLEIIYEQFGDIFIVRVDDGFYAKVSMNNIEMKVADEEVPMNYQTIRANLDIYYYFKIYKGEYKLYYLYGEYDNSLKDYNEEVTQNEYKGINSINEYKSELSGLYNYDKLNSLTNSSIKSIYNTNKSNILIFNTMEGQNISNAATGFLLTDNIAVTTWSYLEKSLINGNYIIAKDGNNKILEIEGIVSVDVDHDYAILKLKDSNGKGVTLGDMPNVEDAVILISTKTGTSLSTNVGIVMSNDDNITSLIPTVEYEEGAPLFNAKGQVIGMNSSEITNSYFSIADKNKVLKLLQNKFKELNVNDISFITFEELKNNYYVEYGTDKVVNELSDKVWNKYKEIGNLEGNIKLELVKASYKNNILSLRYKNNLSSIFSNMQLASSFIEQLKNDDYTEVVNEEMKKVYTNKDYRVTIMSEFDYLIIVIAEN